MARYASILMAVLTATAGIARAQDATVGEVHFANSGSPSAQSPFLRALAQLHNFEYDSAADLFKQAQQVDPGFAMAYWGEAMTYNHPVWADQDRDTAVKALERLGQTPEVRIAKAATEREKDYMRAVEILYGDGDKVGRDFAYADAMAALHRKFPDDVDAAAFHALALLGTAHEGRDFAGSQAGWTRCGRLGCEPAGLRGTWGATSQEAKAARCRVRVEPILLDLVSFQISDLNCLPIPATAGSSTIPNTVGPGFAAQIVATAVTLLATQWTLQHESDQFPRLCGTQ